MAAQTLPSALSLPMTLLVSGAVLCVALGTAVMRRATWRRAVAYLLAAAVLGWLARVVMPSH